MKFEESNIDKIIDYLGEIHSITKNIKIKKLTHKIYSIIVSQVLENLLREMKEKDVIK